MKCAICNRVFAVPPPKAAERAQCPKCQTVVAIPPNVSAGGQVACNNCQQVRCEPVARYTHFLPTVVSHSCTGSLSTLSCCCRCLLHPRRCPRLRCSSHSSQSWRLRSCTTPLLALAQCVLPCQRLLRCLTTRTRFVVWAWLPACRARANSGVVFSAASAACADCSATAAARPLCYDFLVLSNFTTLFRKRATHYMLCFAAS